MWMIDISTPRAPNSILLVDDAYGHLLEGVKWTPDVRPNGLVYAHRRPQGVPKLYIHREIMKPEPGMVVDHIDRNGLNNLRSNLRIVTQRHNIWNKSGSGASPFKGVWRKRNKWAAAITIEGVARRLGVFDTPHDAAVAFDEAALFFGLDRTGLNFPDRATLPRYIEMARAPNEWGYPGIRQFPSGRFGVRVIRDGKRFSLGSFATAIEARQAAEQANG